MCETRLFYYQLILQDQEVKKKPSKKNLRLLSGVIQRFITELEKSDPNEIFAMPVTDQIAPGYSTMIRNPMDFLTIKSKTDNLEYEE